MQLHRKRHRTYSSAYKIDEHKKARVKSTDQSLKKKGGCRIPAGKTICPSLRIGLNGQYISMYFVGRWIKVCIYFWRNHLFSRQSFACYDELKPARTSQDSLSLRFPNRCHSLRCCRVLRLYKRKVVVNILMIPHMARCTLPKKSVLLTSKSE